MTTCCAASPGPPEIMQGLGSGPGAMGERRVVELADKGEELGGTSSQKNCMLPNKMVLFFSCTRFARPSGKTSRFTVRDAVAALEQPAVRAVATRLVMASSSFQAH